MKPGSSEKDASPPSAWYSAQRTWQSTEPVANRPTSSRRVASKWHGGVTVLERREQ